MCIPRRILLILALANVRSALALLRKQRRGDAELVDQNQTAEGPAYRIAILTAGTLRRYFPRDVASNLIAPLVREGHTVDYFLSLNTEEFKAWKTYAQDFRSDPTVEAHGGNLTLVAQWIDGLLSTAGASVRRLVLHEKVDILTEATRSFALNATGFHAGKGPHTLTVRSNVLKLLWQFERLWGSVQVEEAVHGHYDFVMTNKDDLLWMRPFSLNRVLRAPDREPFADDEHAPAPLLDTPGPTQGYNMRCLLQAGSTYDAQSEGGLTEYVLILRREAAGPFLMLFTRLLENPRYWQCHNLEHFMAVVTEEQGVHFTTLPAALLPAQRAGRLQRGNGTVTCIHKACDSATATVGLLRPMDTFPICFPDWWQYRKWNHLPVDRFSGGRAS